MSQRSHTHEKPTHVSLSGGKDFTFTQLYVEHFDALFSLARKLLRSEELAKDVVQDVFVDFVGLSKAGKLNDIRDMKGYLFKSLWTKHSRKILLVRREIDATKEFLLTADKVEVTGNDNIDLEISEKLARAIQRLSPAKRKAFELVKLEGLSEKAAAQKLSISRETVHTQVKEALASIRKHMTSSYILLISLFIS